MKPVCLVRYGEISLKGPLTRYLMEKKLAEAIAFILKRKGIPFEDIKLIRGRIVVYTKHHEEASSIISRVFGVTSTSPAWEISKDFKELEDAVLKLFSSMVREGASFAVRARREDKSYPLTSLEIQRKLGASILAHFKNSHGISVDLEHPDIEVYVEIRLTNAYIYSKVVGGVGGLPYTTSCLLYTSPSPRD